MRVQLFSLPEMMQASCSSLVTLLALQNNVFCKRILLGAGIGNKNFRLFLHKWRWTELKPSCKLPQLSIPVIRMLTQAVLIPKPNSILVSILTSNCSQKQSRNWRRILAEVILVFSHSIYLLIIASLLCFLSLLKIILRISIQIKYIQLSLC